MYKYSIVLLFVFITCFSIAQETGKGFIITDYDMQIAVSCVNERTIHVKVQQGQIVAKQSLVVPDYLPCSPFVVKKDEHNISLCTDKIIATYSYVDKNIIFTDAKTKKTILSEKARFFEKAHIAGEDVYQIKQTFLIDPDESLYGLGQYQEGVFNYRGKSAKLVQANMEIVNPVLLSTRPYGIFWDNYSKTLFEDNDAGTSFWSEVADAIDYYFIYGSSMDDIIAGYHDLTGKVPMFSKSSFGFWQSKERYKSFEELTEVVAEYRKRKIPLDNIVQDWEYWGDRSQWNSLQFAPENFANPKEAISKLHEQYNVNVMLSVWPGFGEQTEVFKDLEKAGALFDEPTWAGYKVMDIYNPKAQEIFWKHLKQGLFDKGIDSWWLDATEPSFREGFTQDKQEEKAKSAGNTYIGSFDRYLSVYSLFLSKVMYDNLRLQNNKRVSILTRSAFAGQQKYGTALWSGDVTASWDVFKKQIPAGLNICMTGIPYWTSDIGGFFVTTRGGEYTKGLADPAYKELYLRWFQQGAFSPIFRAHGSTVPREVWQFGEQGDPFYDGQLEIINLRYTLLSYIYSMAWQATLNSKIMMRALVLDFTEDKNVRNNSDAYLFGSSLLVHPVTSPMYYTLKGKIKKPETNISIYLPAHKGEYWYDFYEELLWKGGETIKYNAPLKKIPLFVKGGSILPIDEVVQYVGEKKNEVMNILVYGGSDAEFSLYEDDNESYNYEKGEYSIINFLWDDDRKELTISDKEGKLTILENRTFKVKFIMPQPGKNKPLIQTKEVLYNNERVTITINKI